MLPSQSCGEELRQHLSLSLGLAMSCGYSPAQHHPSHHSSLALLLGTRKQLASACPPIQHDLLCPLQCSSVCQQQKRQVANIRCPPLLGLCAVWVLMEESNCKSEPWLWTVFLWLLSLQLVATEHDHLPHMHQLYKAAVEHPGTVTGGTGRVLVIYPTCSVLANIPYM